MADKRSGGRRTYMIEQDMEDRLQIVPTPLYMTWRGLTEVERQVLPGTLKGAQNQQRWAKKNSGAQTYRSTMATSFFVR